MTTTTRRLPDWLRAEAAVLAVLFRFSCRTAPPK
jgi:hypothetical protein